MIPSAKAAAIRARSQTDGSEVGFFTPIKSAVASYVGTHGSNIDQVALAQLMEGIIRAAPREPAKHDDAYIEDKVGFDLIRLIADRCEAQRLREGQRGKAVERSNEELRREAARKIDDERQAEAKPTLDQLKTEYPFRARFGKFRLAIGNSGKVQWIKNIGDNDKPNWIDQVTPLCVDGWLENADRGKTTSLRIGFRYRDGGRQTIDIPRRFSGKSWAETYDRLCNAGVRFSGAGEHDGQQAVLQMLRADPAPTKIVIVPRPGWHWLPNVATPVYVSPSGEAFGAQKNIAVELVEPMKLSPSAAKSGSLNQWATAADRVARLTETPAYWVLGPVCRFCWAADAAYRPTDIRREPR